MAEKQPEGQLRLEVPAGNALPGPPIGPALGQHRLNIAEFCKNFNEKSKDMEPNSPCRTVITYYKDSSFTIEIKHPPVSYFVKKAVGLEKGGSTPGRESAGTISPKQVREIAETKLPELNAADIDAAMRIVAGTARSMGIEVQG